MEYNGTVFYTYTLKPLSIFGRFIDDNTFAAHFFVDYDTQHDFRTRNQQKKMEAI